LENVIDVRGRCRRTNCPDSSGGISGNNVNRVGRLRAAHQRGTQGPRNRVSVERFLREVIGFLDRGWVESVDKLSGAIVVGISRYNVNRVGSETMDNLRGREVKL
jgi:hypothetical protein